MSEADRPEESPSAVPASPADPSPSLPREYERTWELELLISGAVIFALIQLPGAVDRSFDRLVASSGSGLFLLIMMGYTYVKVILYTLIATFFIHLVARGYWVGLIGLDAVFPEGVRWERTRHSPVARELYREVTPTLSAQAAAVDRFCSTLFSFAVVIVMSAVIAILMAVVLGAPSVVISQRLFGGDHLLPVLAVLLAVWVLPGMVATGVDRWRGERLGPVGRRRVARVTRFYYRAQLTPISGTITNVFVSNFTRTRSYGVLYVVPLILVSYFTVRDMMIRQGMLEFDGYVYLPGGSAPSAVSNEYYEDRHPPDRLYFRTPSIQSDMARAPFVRLFLPYFPRRHNHLIPERCPGVRPLQGGGVRFDRSSDPVEAARAGAVLACLTRLQPVTLNGRPLSVPFRFYEQPRTGVRGIAAYIPTATLPAGENLLVVPSIPRPGPNARRDGPHHIPFWVAR